MPIELGDSLASVFGGCRRFGNKIVHMGIRDMKAYATEMGLMFGHLLLERVENDPNCAQRPCDAITIV